MKYESLRRSILNRHIPTTMEEEEKITLRREGPFICKEVAQNNCFSDIVYELMQAKVLEGELGRGILRTEGITTHKMQQVLDSIESEPGSFDILVEVLIRRGLSHVASRLDPRAFERFNGVASGNMDRLDTQRMPDMHGVGEPLIPNHFRNLPSLPRRSSSSSSISEAERNGSDNRDLGLPLEVIVKQAKAYGGSHLDASELYRNSSMPRGLVFLANYKNFRPNGSLGRSEDLQTREGSEIDVKNLSLLFHQMGYKIPEVHLNLDKYNTLKALRNFRLLEEHKNVHSCIVVIMSHGRDGKSFYTSDGEWLAINEVVERFSNLECEALKGKPKIFIFQYCRGNIQDLGASIAPVVFQDGGLKVEPDAAYTSVVDRDPTFSDMYIVYSTLEGYVSFRHPNRGSWLMEAICNIFMNYAHNEELDSLMKRVSRQVRGNMTDEGNKQVCEFVQRGFDRHFYFNPSYLDSTDRLSMDHVSRALSESLDSQRGALSPIMYTPRRRQFRPSSWSRSSTPDPHRSPSTGRRRNLSGASNSSGFNEELDPTLLTSESGVTLHHRVRRLSGKRLPFEAVHFLQPSQISNQLDPYNRSFSENFLESQGLSPEPADTSEHEVFPKAEGIDNPCSRSQSMIDTVDHSQTACGFGAEAQVKGSDINMNQEVEDLDLNGQPRHSIKRQLSVPSTNEALSNINNLKKFLQVHDSEPQVLERLARVESFVNKKKYEGKRRKKDNESSSLEY